MAKLGGNSPTSLVEEEQLDYLDTQMACYPAISGGNFGRALRLHDPAKEWKDGVLAIIMRNMSKEWAPFGLH